MLNNSTKVSQKYLEKLDALSEKRYDRIVELLETAKLFEENFKSYGRIVCAVERLDTAIASYFYDILRYKDFHNIPDYGKVNFPKVYAFTTKWILKEKPFYIEYADDLYPRVDEHTLEGLMKLGNEVNEHILISWIMNSHFRQSGEEIEFGEAETEGLIYNLKFRNVDTGLLELLFDGKCSKKLIEI